ncbi:MAG: hypothetical protein AVDCRST_MAG01-01-4577 [uncultured Rubrobacteraceae bacterium]|uniref:Uncharacterized protein n=1 Tax=uncultured Rubrobacteraceae bacterium TaxID=349277 RepID=A0A6J4QXS1_9ACTN|nr:MAG: hypothetical protein AVDCRST_MAG01-01-4577 [uncultured Rubrobacteraceae bacterium]
MLLVVSAVVAGWLWLAGGEPLQAAAQPEVREAPEPFSAQKRAASKEMAAHWEAHGQMRIGSFERPETVPAYDVLDEQRGARDGARGAWLMIDTRSHSEEDYVLITRHVKAEYAELDAVSVEFVDAGSTPFYRGGALIFNTVAGANYIGYIYGPPNNEGYYVEASG